MAKKLKDYYDLTLAKEWADKVQTVLPSFSQADFVDFLATRLDALEFHARQDAFVEAFDKFLPSGYVKRLGVFKRLLGPKLVTDTGMFTYGYFLWPVGRFVQVFGNESPDRSLEFIYELTQRFTGEFAIRPILEKNPPLVLAVLKKWSKDPSVHVRRLCSEAMRTRLPWANKNQVFIDYFDDCVEVLDTLKSSQEKFVQKSVANNINDLYKDRPDLAKKALNILNSESQPSEALLWINKHATRSLRQKS